MDRPTAVHGGAQRAKAAEAEDAGLLPNSLVHQPRHRPVRGYINK